MHLVSAINFVFFLDYLRGFKSKFKQFVTVYKNDNIEFLIISYTLTIFLIPLALCVFKSA